MLSLFCHTLCIVVYAAAAAAAAAAVSCCALLCCVVLLCVGHGVGAALNVHEGPQSISTRYWITTPLEVRDAYTRFGGGDSFLGWGLIPHMHKLWSTKFWQGVRMRFAVVVGLWTGHRRIAKASLSLQRCPVSEHCVAMSAR